MKIFATVATMIGLAAGTSLMAQEQLRIQDRFHTVSVQPCFETFEQVDQYLTTQTEQDILFNSVGLVTLTNQDESETENAVLITVYVDQSSGNFTILKTFVEGVTCLLAEGSRFAPYVE